MQISSLALSNIRSYKSQKVDFPNQGSTLLAGDIGSGKSSLLLAIDFALFGLRPDLPADSLLRHGANRGSVNLSFKINGKDVQIERNLERKNGSSGQSTGHIIVDGEKEDL